MEVVIGFAVGRAALISSVVDELIERRQARRAA